MKKRVSISVFSLLVIFSFTVSAFGGAKWWIMGTVEGSGNMQAVVTLKLVKKGDSPANYISVTSTNKFGQYAFSRPDSGLPPSAYRLVVHIGPTPIMEVDLAGVRPGGRVPPITIHR